MKRSNLLALAMATILLIAGRTAMASRSESADQAVAQADALVQAGNLEAAEPLFEDAAHRYSRAGDSSDWVWVNIKLAGVYQQLGRSELAYNTFHDANAVALKTGDDSMLAAIDNGLGSLAILTGTAIDDPEDGPEPLLEKSYALATTAHDSAVAADAANNLGNLYSYQEHYAEAGQQYERAIHLAEAAGEPATACRSEGNLARVELGAGNFGKADASAESAIARAEKLADSHDKAFVLIGAGYTLYQISDQSPTPRDGLRLKAFNAYQVAAATAAAIGDERSLSYAYGYEGHLYETEKKFDDALTLTRRALFYAQQIESPDILYQWEWQTGRLLRAQGNQDAAIAAYRRAVFTLEGDPAKPAVPGQAGQPGQLPDSAHPRQPLVLGQPRIPNQPEDPGHPSTLRQDIALHYGNPTAHSSFAKEAGGVYSELADLLIQKADRASTPGEKQDYLNQARSTSEKLKSAELDDYFQEQCANIVKANQEDVGEISDKAAVLYIIPLPDRTEILVSIGTGNIENVKSNVTADDLEALCTQFRQNLEKRDTDEYLEQADLLYADLIKPVEPLLAGRSVNTLVFVPDGALRTIPMAALRDEHGKFLIQKYAIAVTPGLKLMQAKPLAEGHVDLILNAISKSVLGFPPLVNVPEEAKNIAAMYPGSTMKMNDDFNDKSFQHEFDKENYSIVHIASHGHFDSDSRKTFVLTFDKEVHLDELEQLLRPNQIKDNPVDLLTLSACETAAGDDRAALGLAGVAIKAGARSAFATLWCVNDEASAVLVSDFYAGVKKEPLINKAQALEHAQCKLIADSRYSHPCYWAPYLLIGNWQ